MWKTVDNTFTPLSCYNMSMIIDDLVYGNFEITEPLLLDLINSSEIERLKRVSQYGIPDQYHHKKNFSRYDHSIGVMLLLRRLGASLEEQAAGLIHDASHSAFSHVSDWVFGEGKSGNEDYQDNIQKSYLEQSSLPALLKKHDSELTDIDHNPDHILLELDLPDLCADRIDYTLREIATDGTKIDLEFIVNSMEATSRGIVFNNQDAARLFADIYLELQRTNWGSDLSKVRFTLLGDALRRGMELGILHKSDFWNKDEVWILRRISSSSDEEIAFCLEQLGSVNPRIKDIRTIQKKARYVDPPIQINGKLTQLSHLDADYAKALAESIAYSNQDFTLPHL